MQSGKQMHESPEYDALIFRPVVSLPIRAGTGGKKKEKGRKKESRKRTGNEAVYNVFHLLCFEEEGKDVIVDTSRRIAAITNCIKYFCCIWIRTGIPTGVRWKLVGHNCVHIYEKPALHSDIV